MRSRLPNKQDARPAPEDRLCLPSQWPGRCSRIRSRGQGAKPKRIYAVKSLLSSFTIEMASGLNCLTKPRVERRVEHEDSFIHPRSVAHCASRCASAFAHRPPRSRDHEVWLCRRFATWHWFTVCSIDAVRTNSVGNQRRLVVLNRSVLPSKMTVGSASSGITLPADTINTFAALFGAPIDLRIAYASMVHGVNSGSLA